MKTKQLQLVNFNQAKRLKAAGFDWDTHRTDWYNSITGEFNEHVEKCADIVIAPTVALALKWFRDVYNLSGEIYATASGWQWTVCKGCNNPAVGGTSIRELGYDGPNDAGAFDTCEATEIALLDELLTLIEKKK
jgi:hypothetical protein